MLMYCLTILLACLNMNVWFRMNMEILVNAHSVVATVPVMSCGSRLQVVDIGDHRQVEHIRSTEGRCSRSMGKCIVLFSYCFPLDNGTMTMLNFNLLFSYQFSTTFSTKSLQFPIYIFVHVLRSSPRLSRFMLRQSSICSLDVPRLHVDHFNHNLFIL